MIKNKLVYLFYYLGLVLAGLFASNVLMLLAWASANGWHLNEWSLSGDIASQLSREQLFVQQIASQVLALILPSVWFIRRTAHEKIIEQAQPFSWSFWGKAVLFFVLCMPLVSLSAYFNAMFPLPSWMEDSSIRMAEFLERLLTFDHTSDIVLAFVAIAIVPAMAEELAFRGVLQNLFVRWMGSPLAGLLAAALLFSAIHMQFDGFIPRFLLGALLGFVYWKGGNLWYPIGLHFLNNAAQLVALVFLDDPVSDAMQPPSEMPALPGVIAASVAAAFAGYFSFIKPNATRHA
ncbi:MAG: CPBP family intramembrane metalloprotease [Saprospiraceae bacterium]|nr:CPBP family intramembrane metalloprotease [Saprospiraceae bacterium]